MSITITDIFDLSGRGHDTILLDEHCKYYFVFTVDPKYFDNNSREAIERKVKRWFDRRVKTKGLKYILLSRCCSKKNKVMYFCGYINDSLSLIDSGARIVSGFAKPIRQSTIKRLGILENRIRSVVYNVPEWKFGFSSVVDAYQIFKTDH